MSLANLDAAGLAAVDFQGLISEDVMNSIWDISNVPLPFTDSIGSDGTHNDYAEWTKDKLQDVDITNATVDGADAGTDDSSTGERVGNRHQMPDKVVRVSGKARSSGTIGFADTLAYQVMMRQRELRRDVEAISLENQASVADDGDSQPGLLAGFPSWLTTNTDRGVAGADGGFDGSGTVDAATPGAARALTETQVRDIAQSVWEQGGDPSRLMSVPGVIRELSSYMFTSSARIATLQRDTQGQAGAATAMGSVNVFLTDFNVTLEFVPNRLQQTHVDSVATQVADVFIYDTSMVMQGFMRGYQVEDLAKTGTADNRQMTAIVTLKVLNEAAHGVIADIDPTLPAAA